MGISPEPPSLGRREDGLPASQGTSPDSSSRYALQRQEGVSPSEQEGQGGNHRDSAQKQRREQQEESNQPAQNPLVDQIQGSLVEIRLLQEGPQEGPPLEQEGSPREQQEGLEQEETPEDSQHGIHQEEVEEVKSTMTKSSKSFSFCLMYYKGLNSMFKIRR